MKKFISGTLCGAVLTTSIIAFAANYEAITATFPVFVNGVEWTTDKPVVTIDGSTYLPLRAMGNALGVPVNWNEDLRQVEIGNTSSPDITFNDTFMFNDLEITFKPDIVFFTIRQITSTLDGATIIIVPITVKNTRAEGYMLSSTFYTIYNPNKKVSPHQGVISTFFYDDNIGYKWIAPGETTNSFMHILYEGDGDYCIEFDLFGEMTEVILPIEK